jgi:hypothetical protein
MMRLLADVGMGEGKALKRNPHYITGGKSKIN